MGACSPGDAHDLHMRHWTTRKYWIGFILFAVVLHLVLLLTVKRSFLSMFLRPIGRSATPEHGSPFSPDAIITVPLAPDEESAEAQVERPVISDEPERRERIDDTPASGHSASPNAATDDLGGQDQIPLGSSGSAHAVSIPPKPLEIAWPDTRGLKKCLGESIDLRMLIADDGRILRIETAGGGSPRECVEAAKAAARKIVFQPGLVDGKRTEMWTEIRIDFRDRR
jgi:hypothetical protein